MFTLNSCDTAREATRMGGPLSFPFCSPEGFLVIQASSPHFNVPTRLISPKQVSSHPLPTLQFYRVLNLPSSPSESDQSRPALISSPSPGQKSPQASGANPNQTLSPDASRNGPRRPKSRPCACRGTGITLLAQKPPRAPEPNQTKRSSTTSTLERISWRPRTQRAFRPR